MDILTKRDLRAFHRAREHDKQLIAEAKTKRAKYEQNELELENSQKKVVSQVRDGMKALATIGRKRRGMYESIEHEKDTLKKQRTKTLVLESDSEDDEPHEVDPERLSAKVAKQKNLTKQLDAHYDNVRSYVKDKHVESTKELDALAQSVAKKVTTRMKRECQKITSKVRDDKHKKYSWWKDEVISVATHNAERHLEIFELKYELLYAEAVKKMSDDRALEMRNLLADKYETLKHKVVRKEERAFPTLEGSSNVQHSETEDDALESD